MESLIANGERDILEGRIIRYTSTTMAEIAAKGKADYLAGKKPKKEVCP